jgi:hypothetical protein
MQKEPFPRRTLTTNLLVPLLTLVVVLTWMGCASTVKERQGEGGDMGVGRYYYFEDVRVPRELNYEEDESFVYETPAFKAGSMVFKKWRLDPNSLFDFFVYYMERDNWKLMNSFRGTESILNFSKPDKSCMIKIRETWYGTTVVEIRVGPVGMKKM